MRKEKVLKMSLETNKKWLVCFFWSKNKKIPFQGGRLKKKIVNHIAWFRISYRF